MDCSILFNRCRLFECRNRKERLYGEMRSCMLKLAVSTKSLRWQYFFGQTISQFNACDICALNWQHFSLLCARVSLYFDHNHFEEFYAYSKTYMNIYLNPWIFIETLIQYAALRLLVWTSHSLDWQSVVTSPQCLWCVNRITFFLIE